MVSAKKAFFIDGNWICLVFEIFRNFNQRRLHNNVIFILNKKETNVKFVGRQNTDIILKKNEFS